MPRLRVARPTNCSPPARYDVGLSPEFILYRIILPSAITCSGHRDSKGIKYVLAHPFSPKNSREQKLK